MIGIESLFVTGITINVVGALLLARSLLDNPVDLAKRAGTYWGRNRHERAALIRDHALGLVGSVLLAIGFVLQAAGYVVTTAIDEPARSSLAGVIGVAAIVGALSWSLSRWSTKRLGDRIDSRVEQAERDLDAEHEGS